MIIPDLTVIMHVHHVPAYHSQGHEPHVAAGAKELFAQKRVHFVNMEFGPAMMAKNFSPDEPKHEPGVAAIKLLELMHSSGFICYEWTNSREVSPDISRDFKSFVMGHLDANYDGAACVGRCFTEGLGRASELFCAEASSLVANASAGTSVLSDVTKQVKFELSCS
mmetsp:Transcript_48664/g.136908  ORF Transcript_48664/g.136908 Transcript_48664/m.136908 type:complete len:166 (-) Transcript_48664:209-706(-)